MVDDIRYVCMLWRVGCTKGKVSNHLLRFGGFRCQGTKLRTLSAMRMCRRYQCAEWPMPLCSATHRSDMVSLLASRRFHASSTTSAAQMAPPMSRRHCRWPSPQPGRA